MAHVSLRGLSFRYPRGPSLLEGIDLEAPSGEVLSLIGPNAAGKSTLLKCMAGLLSPDQGEILLQGRPLRSLQSTDRARRIAYVPQAERQGFPATVFDTVLLGRRPHMAWKPGNRDLEVVSEILSSLELGELALRETFRLSGGQRQKVSIARALAQEPEVLLLDEPTSSLDLRHQLEVMDLVADQARKGITAVAALHDLNLALRFSDRVAMLKEGRIYASGGPDIVTAKRVAEVYGVQVEISSREAGSIVVPTGPA